MTAQDPREAKLPKWTQELLASLRRELADVRADFEEYADKEMPDDAVAVANPYDEHPRLAARKGETVRFTLGPWTHVDIEVQDDELEVSGSAGVSIQPHMSNHLTLFVRDR
jgi:hypothetical protein